MIIDSWIIDWLRRYKYLLAIFFIIGFIIIIWEFVPWQLSPALSCDRVGTHSLFVATFDSDTVGGSPAPTGPLVYGADGAGLELVGTLDNLEVVNTPAFGSNALQITRETTVVMKETGINTTMGDIEDLPCCGVYHIRLRIQGTIIPDYAVSSAVILVDSTEQKIALILRLYDGSYHHIVNQSSVRLDGSYDPTVTHVLHIILDLDNRNYSVCVNEEMIASAEPLFDSDYRYRHGLNIIMPGSYTENFESQIVVDDIRVTK